MKKRTLILLYSLACLLGIFTAIHSEALMAPGWWNQSYCPTCYRNQYYNQSYNTMPWGQPNPWWWNTGPSMMYSNFYSPSPWNYGYNPGVMHQYYPGGGGMFAAKPNLYIEGAEGTDFRVKIRFTEDGTNWLAAVPVHGNAGWQGKLGKQNLLETNDGTYSFLYSDYRGYGKAFQDKEGFCATKEQVISQMARRLSQATFNAREIADFAEYWSVKLPPTKRYCVYPQDERQLETIAALEVSPQPISVRRVLFMVQVEEGLKKNGKLFSAEPIREWTPQPLRLPATESKSGIKVREWGVGFLAAP